MTLHSANEIPSPQVSVVISALSEARNLLHVLVRAPLDDHEVVPVDSHSVDDTVTVARQLWPDVHIVRQTRVGKGSALASGFTRATSDIIVVIDADGLVGQGEVPQFVTSRLEDADVATGTSFVGSGVLGELPNA